ncbi:MAG: hypothetical protein WCK51_06305 [Armatimonadota bacterium]
MDGEYSKLEKDFLGNERMVHYNSDGVAVSASRVERAEDGSMTVGEPIPLSTQSQPTQVPVRPTTDAGPGSYPPGTVATIGIASFVLAALAALFIINSNKSDSPAERFNTAVYRDPVQVQPRTENLEDVPPPREYDSPQPRQEDEVPPGDPTRPRIDIRNEEPEVLEKKPEPTHDKPDPEPKKGSDPIDLRGDGDESR